MMTQEEFMDVQVLRSAGWSIRQIAEHVGYHPATVSAWLKGGGPPGKRSASPDEQIVDERWRVRIAGLLAQNASLQATSILRIIKAEGFDGSYPSLTRYLREVRGTLRGRAAAVAMPIDTAPGEEFQFDWSDCNPWGRRWGWDDELHCFGAVLCWSRRKRWWFTCSIDRPHTLEGLAGWFDDLDGVPAVGRTDRMGQLGQSRGRSFRWDPPALEFARHYGVALKACAAGDAARKGKVERPFRDLKSGFLAEMDLDPPADIGELNRRAERWLAVHAHAVRHRSTKVTPDERFRIEQPLLGRLPRVRFDTARREPRRVGRFPLIEWDAVFYSVPPDAVGALVEVRQPVTEAIVEFRLAGQLVAVHRLAAPGAEPQWLPEHRAAGEAIALGRHGRHLRAVDTVDGTAAAPAPLLDLGDGDYDVDTPDLDLLDMLGSHPDDHPGPDHRAHGDTTPGVVGCECLGGGW
ncbi:MAG TPA: IS21 family transposase [Jiangellaceae bacterium]|nr:IS21 family transposase [Jiangellaceae bacterium]